MYRILLRYSGCVQPLSCDEAYIDVTGLGDPEGLAAAIRADIERETHCQASAGGRDGFGSQRVCVCVLRGGGGAAMQRPGNQDRPAGIGANLLLAVLQASALTPNLKPCRHQPQPAADCPAGIGPNLLLARLATKKAKPAGQHRVRQAGAQAFLGDLPVSALPGVGWSMEAKLAELTQVTQVTASLGSLW